MRGRPFQPGNKHGRGRPRGSRNKGVRVSQAMLDSHAEGLTKRCLFLAYQGNPTAMRLCMERLVPRRQRTLQFNLSPMKTVADLAAASDSVLSGVARGELTPAEGHAFSGMLDERRSMIETQDLDQRLRALEDLNQSSSGPR